MTERITDPGPESDISFSVTVDEANLLLEALGELPFSRVFELIAKLQAQGQSQLVNNDGGGPMATSGGSNDE